MRASAVQGLGEAELLGPTDGLITRLEALRNLPDPAADDSFTRKHKVKKGKRNCMNDWLATSERGSEG